MRISKRSQPHHISELLNAQKQYLSCKKCRAILNIYCETKHVTNKPQMEHYMNSRQKQFIKNNAMTLEVQKLQLLYVPPSQIMNTRIIGKEGKWMLQCEQCSSIVGIIDSSEVLFIKDHVEMQTIKYQARSNNLKNALEKEQQISKQDRRLQSLQRLERQVQRYIKLALKLLEQKMELIQTKRLQKSQQQFHNFIKFYQKWKTNHTNTNIGRQYSTIVSIAR